MGALLNNWEVVYNQAMAIQTAKIPSQNFKDLIKAVLKFPPSASVAASEVVHFAVNRGRARASVAGTVVSTATVVGMHDLEAFTADYRSLSAYAEHLPADAMVDLERSTKVNLVRLICGEQKLDLALTLGEVIPKPKVPEPFFTVTEETAKTLKWLASVAEKDESKPDMCCVYLKDGAAMAGNQKCIAVARTEGLPAESLPLPLQLCSVLEPGDTLSKAEGGLILVSGHGVSQVPYMISSIKFPAAVVARLEAASGTTYGVCKAAVMSSVFSECCDCVARIPKSQAYIIMTFKDGKIQVKAESQTATFRTLLDGTAEKDGDLWLELPEAEEALVVFDKSDVICRKLSPKGETALEGGSTKVFFAPVHIGGSK
jgi:hypothetical protein